MSKAIFPAEESTCNLWPMTVSSVTLGLFFYWSTLITAQQVNVASAIGIVRDEYCDLGFRASSLTLQTITQQEKVTQYLLFISIYITYHRTRVPTLSRPFQRLLYLLTNHIAHPDFWIFKWLKAITWLWRWLPHRLSKHQLPTTVLLKTPAVQMIIFYQGMLLLGSDHSLKNWAYYLRCPQTKFCHRRAFQRQVGKTSKNVWYFIF